MRALCINGEPYPKEFPRFIPLQKGKEYLIIGTSIGYYMDGEKVDCYRLEGIPWLYEKDRFILANVDETKPKKEDI